MMQAPPPQMMMAAEESKRRTMNMVMTLFLMLGLLLLAVGAAVYAFGNMAGTTDDNKQNLQGVYAPVLWDFGIFLLILAIFGMALMRQDLDPLARLLMYLVAFILVLLIFTAPYLMFSAPSLR